LVVHIVTYRAAKKDYHNVFKLVIFFPVLLQIGVKKMKYRILMIILMACFAGLLGVSGQSEFKKNINWNKANKHFLGFGVLPAVHVW